MPTHTLQYHVAFWLKKQGFPEWLVIKVYETGMFIQLLYLRFLIWRRFGSLR